MIYDYKIQYGTGGSNDLYVYEFSTASGSITFELAADGVTNDRVKLQEILDEMNDRGGGTLMLPPGKEIFINGSNSDWQTLVIYSNIVLSSSATTSIVYGENTASRVISSKIDNLSDGTSNNEVYYPVENFTMRNIVVKNASGNQSFPSVALLYIKSDQVKDNRNIEVSNCAFFSDSSTAFGIYVNKVDGLKIDTCDFTLGKTMIRVEENEFSNSDVKISNCTFSGDEASISCIQTGEIENLIIENCTFSNANLGISISKRNKNLFIRDNIFQASLTNNPIRVIGDQDENEFTENLWISGNEMNVARVDSYIENNLTRLDDGRITLPGGLQLTGISAINIAMLPEQTATLYHQNVVIADNIANGSDYGFFDGGSADLFSVKDILRLKCYGNTARNSGDLGFAIERCNFAVVSDNTADRNNSCGIGIYDSTHVDITGNICSNNELCRDGAYINHPYGGIRVENTTLGALIDGNYFYANAGTQRSFQNELASNSNYVYNDTTGATQRYGIVIKNQNEDVPFGVKIGTNHYSGMLFGGVFNNVRSTQIVNDYTRTTPPTVGDYPLGTRLRNNLMASSTIGTKEWYVSNRIQMTLEATANAGSFVVNVAPVDSVAFVQLNFGEDISNKVYENTDLNTIKADDIIGIMMDDYDVHWTTVVSILGNDITIQDALPLKSTFGAPALRKTIVCLRWEAL